MSRLPYRCRIALGRGQGCPAPLILDLIEALRAEKKKFKSVPPPYCTVWTTLSPLSEDLDQPLQGDYWSLICAFCCFFPLCISARSSEQRSRKKDAKSFWHTFTDRRLSINYLIFKKGLQKQAGGCALLCTRVVVLIFLTPSSVPREEGRVVDSYLGIVESLRVWNPSQASLWRK